MHHIRCALGDTESFLVFVHSLELQAISLLTLGPFIDKLLVGSYPHEWKMVSIGSSQGMLFLLLSCSAAVFVNLSQYLCISMFSPVGTHAFSCTVLLSYE